MHEDRWIFVSCLTRSALPSGGGGCAAHVPPRCRGGAKSVRERHAGIHAVINALYPKTEHKTVARATQNMVRRQSKPLKIKPGDTQAHLDVTERHPKAAKKHPKDTLERPRNTQERPRGGQGRPQELIETYGQQRSALLFRAPRPLAKFATPGNLDFC